MLELIFREMVQFSVKSNILWLKLIFRENDFLQLRIFREIVKYVEWESVDFIFPIFSWNHQNNPLYTDFFLAIIYQSWILNMIDFT